jgi:hypothetical protein
MINKLDELPALVDVNQILTIRDYMAIHASDGDIAQAQFDYLELHRKPLTRAQARYEHADHLLKQRGAHQ